ncbi:orotate phosphoribosyltransferase [bacterium]|nr:orotate phosphoribosyltransferase [bacterium]
MNNSALLNLFTKTDALLEGHFKLSSGKHADKYLQCAKALQYPGYAEILGKFLAEKFDQIKATGIISPAIGGLIIGHEVASAMGVRFIFTERQETKMTLRRGFEIVTGERLIIIEDVITTGRSTREVVSIVQDFGGEVAGIGCLANRSLEVLDLPMQPEALLRLRFNNWTPERCPLCKKNQELESPGSRFKKSE